MDQQFDGGAGNGSRRHFKANSFVDGDPRTIDIRDRSEIAYWTKALDATPARLLEAVAAVGNSAQAVKDFLAASRFACND